MAKRAEFVHLHQHSEWSLLDGACRVAEMPQQARALGMDALAITDHGVMHGVLDFYHACAREGVKPLIGCEVYVAPRSRLEKEGQVDKDPFHLVLLARDLEGYRNLVRVVSRAHLDGFYYKPRVDHELLAQHAAGITVLSACLGAEVPQYVLQEKLDQAAATAAFYRDVFGRDHFFLELQDHGIPEQRTVNRELVRLARDLGVGLVATNDAHYLRREDARAHDVLLCIQTGKSLDSPGRLRFPTQEFYLKSPEEMAAVFAEVPEALRNTVAVADQCNLRLEFGKYLLPNFRLPEGHTPGSYLRQLCEERLPRRYPDPSPAVRRQLDYELEMIDKMGFSAYLLIVWDFCDFARRRGIPVGPGRGSAAGCLVSYVLGITNIDPLRYNLVFERFLNPERVTMPDIDIDFCFERRGEVIEYVTERYGADCVAQIAAFGTMGARAVIRDVGRTLGFAPGETDRIAKLVPDGVGVTLADALQPGAELARAAERDPRVAELVAVARLLEGTPRHASVHAAGVVIAPEPLADLVPLMRTKDGKPAIQFDMNQCKKLGLLKMDFLGLRNLTVIEDCRRRVEARTGRPLDVDDLPLDDPATYRMLGEGHTVGVFQLESSGMTELVRRLRPGNIEDIIAAGALFRPGPMENIPLYLKAKHGGAPSYPHPDLEPILRDTYGIMIYQEQVQQVAARMAGFTLGEADQLRRAIGEKNRELMDTYRRRFIEGCVRNGHDERLAEELYAQIEKFAGYGFNKCVPGDTEVVEAGSGRRLTVGAIVREGLRPVVVAVDDRQRPVPRRVLDAVASGVQPLLRLRTRGGRSVRCTAHHRVLTAGGWREAGSLAPGERLATVVWGTGAPAARPRHAAPAGGPGGAGGGAPGGGTALRTLARTLRAPLPAQVAWDPLVAVEPAGEEETYDLTVEGLHNFVADDVVVHNSHSAAYGYITYQTAYLKANYPVEYMAALLTSMASAGGNRKKDSAAIYIAEARRLGIAVLPPDVNESRADFADFADPAGDAAHPGRIRVGLAAVKNVGEAAVQSILRAREEGGPFRGLTDFCRRVDLRVCNRRAIESLIKAGAFDSLGAARARLLAGLEDAMKAAQTQARQRARGQRSLFDLLGPAPDAAAEAGEGEVALPPVPEFAPRELLAQEKEALGLYISGHPLEPHAETLRLRTHPIAALQERLDGDRCTVGGLVAGLRRTATRKGDAMAFLALEDLSGQTEVVLFPKLYAALDKELIAPDRLVLVRGRVSWRGERRPAGEGAGDAEGGNGGEEGEVTVVAEEVESLLDGPSALRLAAAEVDAFFAPAPAGPAAPPPPLPGGNGALPETPGTAAGGPGGAAEPGAEAGPAPASREEQAVPGGGSAGRADRRARAGGDPADGARSTAAPPAGGTAAGGPAPGGPARRAAPGRRGTGGGAGRAGASEAAAAPLVREEEAVPVRLAVPSVRDELGLQLLEAVLRAHPGERPVELHFAREGLALACGPSLRVDGGDGFWRDVEAVPFAAPPGSAAEAGPESGRGSVAVRRQPDA